MPPVQRDIGDWTPGAAAHALQDAMLGHVPVGTIIHGVIAGFFAVATMMVRLWTGPSGPPVATTELGSVTDMLLAEDLLLLVTDDASGCRRCRARRREPLERALMTKVRLSASMAPARRPTSLSGIWPHR